MTRIAVWYLASTVLVGTSICIILYLVTVSYIDKKANAFLADRILAIKNEQDQNGHLKELIEWEWPRRLNEKLFVIDAPFDGRPAIQTPSMPKSLYQKMKNGIIPRFPRTIKLSAGAEMYVLTSAPTTSAHVFLALDLTNDEQFLSHYRLYILTLTLLTIAMGLAVGRKLATSALAPLHYILGLAKKTHFSNLSGRLPIDRLPTEIEPVATHLNAMLGRLEEGVNRLSRFSSDLAHELRTPVNNIRSEAEIALNRSRTITEYKDVIGSILEETDRLSRIIDAMLFLSKAENPANKVAKEDVDLNKTVHKLMEFFEGSLTDASIKADMALASGLMVSAEPTLFERALSNLISNSIAYTKKGGTIHITTRRKSMAAEICIEDTGIGIPADALSKIFDRFYRVDPSRHERAGSGFGLGLTIVKTIVDLHGGTIDIQSVPDRGTTVTIRWPLARGQNQSHVQDC